MSITVQILNNKLVKISLRKGEIINHVKDPLSLIKLLDLGWNIEEYGKSFLVLKNGDNIKLKCRLKEGFDFGHVLEIFESNTYLQNVQGFVVIDIGASTGDSSIYFAMKGAKEIYGVEPMEESFDIATYNINVNNLGAKIHLINAALYDKAGKTELTVSSQNPNANSINLTETVKKYGMNFDSKRTVETISLKNIVYQFSLKKIGLLKMDCEGCEYVVLQSIEDDILSLVDNIVLEYHDGIKFLADLLERKGYNVSYDNTEGSGILKASSRAIKYDQSIRNTSSNAL